MAKKSTKTSHVLSLIANTSESSDSETPTEEIQSNSTIEMENSQINSNPVSEIIREELEKTVHEEMNEIEQEQEKEQAPIDSNEIRNADEKDIKDFIDAKNSSNEEIMTTVDPVSAPPEISEFSLDSFDENTETNDNNTDDNPTYINIVESLVKNKAIPTMKKLGICTCDKCVNDVMAYALNMLPPCYVVTDTGKLFAKLNSYEKQYAADLLTAIAKSCLQIKKNPRH